MPLRPERDDCSEQLMIALFYWYINVPTQSLNGQVCFHKSLCSKFNLQGRIRISSEGLNGVLSGKKKDLEEYAERMKEEVSKFRCCSSNDSSSKIKNSENLECGNADNDTPISQRGIAIDADNGVGDKHGPSLHLQYGQTLDVKYCHLRNDIPHDKQLFDSLSVKITKEVVSLNEPDETSNHQQNNKKRSKKKKKKKKNKGDRYEEIMGAYHEQLQQQQEQQQENVQEITDREGDNVQIRSLEQDTAMLNLDEFEPANHLSPTEWNNHLLSYKNKCPSSDENEYNESTSNPNNSNDNNNDGGGGSGAILIDARNIYESKIGYFSSSNVPTLLTNTRKYSTITSVFNESSVMQNLSGKNVYMYCTGGVRCERASVYLQALAASEAWPTGLERPKSIYQLEGGIQKYLEVFGELEGSPSSSLSPSVSENIDRNGNNENVDVENKKHSNHNEGKESIKTKKENCLFHGKNFVFDPRRYDPVVGNVYKAVGQCIICSVPFDDYDNAHAPCENREARCCRCRVLILVCNDCRMKVRVWGEKDGGGEEDVCQLQESQDRHRDDGGGDDNTGAELQHNRTQILPDVYCGRHGKECINEGNDVNHYEIIV